MNHTLMGGGDAYPPPDRKPATLSFVPRDQESCPLWPFLNRPPSSTPLPNMLAATLHIWKSTSENKATPLNSMQLRLLLRSFSCY